MADQRTSVMTRTAPGFRSALVVLLGLLCAGAARADSADGRPEGPAIATTAPRSTPLRYTPPEWRREVWTTMLAERSARGGGAAAPDWRLEERWVPPDTDGGGTAGAFPLYLVTMCVLPVIGALSLLLVYLHGMSTMPLVRPRRHPTLPAEPAKPPA